VSESCHRMLENVSQNDPYTQNIPKLSGSDLSFSRSFSSFNLNFDPVAKKYFLSSLKDFE
jgi:hypothetical protein